MTTPTIENVRGMLDVLKQIPHEEHDRFMFQAGAIYFALTLVTDNGDRLKNRLFALMDERDCSF